MPGTFKNNHLATIQAGATVRLKFTSTYIPYSGKQVRFASSIIFAFLICYSLRSAAQGIVPAAKVHAIIQKMSLELEDRYPFPEISKRYVKALKANERNYQNLEPELFAARLTDDLRKVHKDMHLAVYVKSLVINSPNNNVANKRSEEEKLQIINYGFKNVELDNFTSTAYINIPNGFFCTQEAFEMAGHVMGMAAYSKNVIIDVRGDGGGAGGMGHFLASYFFEPGEEKLYLNGFERDRKHEMQEYTFGYVPGKRLTKSKLYILTDRNTGSACEGFAFAMQKLGRATVVGDTTAGAGIAMVGADLEANMEMHIPVKMLVAPGTEVGWEGMGVFPDVVSTTEDARATAMNLINKDIASDTSSSADNDFNKWMKEDIGYSEHTKPDTATVKMLCGFYGGGSSIAETSAGLALKLNQGKSVFILKPLAKDVFVLTKPDTKKNGPFLTRLYITRTADGKFDYFTLKRLLPNRDVYVFPAYRKL